MDPLSRVSGTWRILRHAYAASPATRRSVHLLGLLCMTAVVVQFIDSTGRAGPRAAAEWATAICSTLGVVALGLAIVLYRAGQCVSVTRPLLLGSLEFDTLHETIQALPTLGLLSAVLLTVAIVAMVVRAVMGSPTWFVVFSLALYASFLVAAVRTVTQASRFLYAHAEEQSRTAAQAQAETAQAQLAALQAQVNPHFLFNALNTVAALVRTDSRAAERTVEHLADVLRRTLDRSRVSTCALADEIDYLRSYLDVERQRWGERLRVEWSVPEDTLTLQIPTMSLQPLVENALKHGIGTRMDGGTLWIASERSDGRLHLTVRDNGVGFPPRLREGTGLSNLRARLRTLYGEAASLERAETRDGATVEIIVPAIEVARS